MKELQLSSTGALIIINWECAGKCSNIIILSKSFPMLNYEGDDMCAVHK